MEYRRDQLGHIIKTARIEKHMTQKQLASALGITARHLMAIENANKRPSYDLLFRIIRLLEISADMIFYPGCEYGHSTMGKVRLLLNRFDEKEVNAMITALLSLVEGK